MIQVQVVNGIAHRRLTLSIHHGPLASVCRSGMLWAPVWASFPLQEIYGGPMLVSCIGYGLVYLPVFGDVTVVDMASVAETVVLNRYSRKLWI